MRIISPGQLPSEKTYRATCGVCSCVFEAARKDASRDVDDQIQGHELEFKCPTCKYGVWVKA